MPDIATPSWARLVSKKADTLVLVRDGPGPTLYVFHDLLGGVDSYSHLAQLLERRVCGLQVPTAKLLPTAISVGEVAASYARRLQRAQPTGNFLLCGWCAGAVLALETAAQLRAAGRQVQLLVAIDGAPWNVIRETGLWYYGHLLYWLCKRSPHWIGVLGRSGTLSAAGRSVVKRWRLLRNDLAGSSDEFYRRRNPEELPEAVVQYAERLLVALHAHAPKPYGGPLQVYIATKYDFPYRRRDCIWRTLAPQCDILPVAGTRHGDILDPRGAEIIARHLRQRLP